MGELSKINTVEQYFDLINKYLAENPDTDGQKISVLKSYLMTGVTSVWKTHPNSWRDIQMMAQLLSIQTQWKQKYMTNSRSQRILQDFV